MVSLSLIYNTLHLTLYHTIKGDGWTNAANWLPSFLHFMVFKEYTPPRLYMPSLNFTLYCLNTKQLYSDLKVCVPVCSVYRRVPSTCRDSRGYTPVDRGSWSAELHHTTPARERSEVVLYENKMKQIHYPFNNRLMKNHIAVTLYTVLYYTVHFTKDTVTANPTLHYISYCNSTTLQNTGML